MTPHANKAARPAARLTLALALSVMSAGPLHGQERPLAAPAPARVAAPAPGQPAGPSEILSDRPDADFDQAAELLGEEFVSKGHGIALRPPKDSTPVRRVGAKDIIEFVNEARGWTLKVSKIMLPQPGELTETRDAHGNVVPGVLEFTAQRLKEEMPDAQFLRQDKITVADGDAGMLALRYTRNLKSLLAQQAIIQRTDQMYYLLALTSNAAPRVAGAPGDKEQPPSNDERLAVEAFRQVLDSVKLLDLREVRQDQDERLFRTRGLLVNFRPERLRAALMPPAPNAQAGEQWVRVLKNGKDVGYTYTQERVEVKGAQEGIEIRSRSRVLPGNNLQADTGSIHFASMDLRHEDWSTLSETVNLKQRAAAAADKGYKPPQIAEFGVSDRRSVPGQGDVYSLQVIYESTQERVEPLVRDLPPFYLPQAVSHLLPRLLPLGEPKTFMFYVYVPDTREVVARYVDVEAQRKVEFNNEVVVAVPVQDRLALEGPVTTHYMSPKGKWIGSESKDLGITVVPTTKNTLLSLWKDADLSRPEAPGPQTPAAADQRKAGEAAAVAPDAPTTPPGRPAPRAGTGGKKGKRSAPDQ